MALDTGFSGDWKTTSNRTGTAWVIRPSLHDARLRAVTRRLHYRRARPDASTEQFTIASHDSPFACATRCDLGGDQHGLDG